VGILLAFMVMSKQGINANIMSLGGIAIAIGVMVDAAIVMIENAINTSNMIPGQRVTGRSLSMLPRKSGRRCFIHF